jgi:hypothetical protein
LDLYLHYFADEIEKSMNNARSCTLDFQKDLMDFVTREQKRTAEIISSSGSTVEGGEDIKVHASFRLGLMAAKIENLFEGLKKTIDEQS